MDFKELITQESTIVEGLYGQSRSVCIVKGLYGHPTLCVAEREVEVYKRQSRGAENERKRLQKENEKLKKENHEHIGKYQQLEEQFDKYYSVSYKQGKEIMKLKEENKKLHEVLLTASLKAQKKFDALEEEYNALRQEKDEEEYEYIGRGDETLDRWVEENYGEDMDWEFDVRKERKGEYCHAKVEDDDGDIEIGIVIVPKEKCPHGRSAGFQQDIGECECGGYFDECKTCGDKYKCQHCGLCDGIDE